MRQTDGQETLGKASVTSGQLQKERGQEIV